MIYNLFLLFCLYLPFEVALIPTEGVDLASGRVVILILALIWLISALKNRQIFVPAKIQTALVLSFLFLSSLSLFFCYGCSASTFLSRLDYGGISILIACSTFPPNIYGLACDPCINKLGYSTMFLIASAVGKVL